NAATRFGLTLRSTSPPPTENTSTASRAANLLVFSQPSKTVAQPSSFVRAVSSETLSVGAYASIPAIFRKSFTACDAFAALPPPPKTSPRMSLPRSCLPHSLRRNEPRRLLESGGRSNLVKSLLYLHSRQLPVRQNIAIQIRQVARFVHHHPLKRLRHKRAQSIIDKLHPRRALLLAISQYAPLRKLHVARIPLPFIPKHGHQRQFPRLLKLSRHSRVIAQQIRIPIQRQKRMSQHRQRPLQRPRGSQQRRPIERIMH